VIRNSWLDFVSYSYLYPILDSANSTTSNATNCRCARAQNVHGPKMNGPGRAEMSSPCD